ncbi:hypothetical protein [Fontibacillus sp. BL9]|uniref:hypothetical protein n=1 Tax=Fontibacillus sp. BL9 TaxID=3389971 RepID=UPI003978EAE8
MPDEKSMADNLAELNSRSAFYEPTRLMQNYEAANNEVNRWYRIVEKSGLIDLIKESRLISCTKK